MNFQTATMPNGFKRDLIIGSTYQIHGISQGVLIRINPNSGYFKVSNGVYSYMTVMFRNVGNEIIIL